MLAGLRSMSNRAGPAAVPDQYTSKCRGQRRLSAGKQPYDHAGRNHVGRSHVPARSTFSWKVTDSCLASGLIVNAVAGNQ